MVTIKSRPLLILIAMVVSLFFSFEPANADTISNPIITSISGSYGESLALKSDGTVWAWGWNNVGQLGDGTNIDKASPVQVQGLSDVIAIDTKSGGEFSHSLVLKSDGTVWAWGGNGSGQLGDGTNINQNTPVQVQGLRDVIAIACGYTHSLALKSDGTVWAWGDNGYGQLGDGSTIYKNTPVQILGLSEISAIAGGAFTSMALSKDGTVWTWGANGFGLLGTGTNDDYSSTPVQVNSLSNVIAIDISMALKSDGTVWAWGWNGNGRIGDGTTTSRYTPVQVQGLSNAIAIYNLDGSTSMATMSDGTVWAWGENNYGQLGNGSTIDKSIPIQVQGLTDIIDLSGSYHVIALKADGTVYTWGWNDYGQLGDGTTTSMETPIDITRFLNVSLPFNPDQNNDGIIDLYDVIKVAKDNPSKVRDVIAHYGETF